jgi:GNAT superfamily N-acetyltransferase
MHIRLAEENDIDVICAFDHVAENGEGRRLFLRKAIGTGHCHVAEDDSILKGYVILDYSFFEFGFVELLYVHPDHRREGVGAALMQYAESICTTEKLFTSTNLSNTTMQALLMKLGYEESGIVHGLDEGDPELFYRKELTKREN